MWSDAVKLQLPPESLLTPSMCFPSHGGGGDNAAVAYVRRGLTYGWALAQDARSDSPFILSTAATSHRALRLFAHYGIGISRTRRTTRPINTATHQLPCHAFRAQGNAAHSVMSRTALATLCHVHQCHTRACVRQQWRAAYRTVTPCTVLYRTVLQRKYMPQCRRAVAPIPLNRTLLDPCLPALPHSSLLITACSPVA